MVAEITRLDPNTGQLLGVNLADFRSLIGQHLCGERVVPYCAGGSAKHHSYPFAPTPRPPQPTQQSGLPQKARTTGPDDKALHQPDTEKVVQLLPRVEL